MDDKRFDQLARLVGKGASRRTILKGLLGLGGAAVTGTVVTEEAGARTIGTRPTIPPPPPGGCPLGQVSCNGVCCPFGRCFSGVCCPIAGTSRCGTSCCPTGQCTETGLCCPAGQDVCRTICCPDGTCARSGNTDICCTAPRFACGLDCCQSEAQCCDGECCPAGTICLTQVFPEGPFVEEETCCPSAQTCDNRCCDGTCFTPRGSTVTGPDRTCCPADESVTLCSGTGAFAGVALCCSGDAPECCRDENGAPACLRPDQCCSDDECDGCSSCVDFTCQRDCSECCMVGDDPQAWFCLPGECCPGIPDYCGGGQLCCPETQPGFGTFCAECCGDADCDGCSTCVNGVCERDCSECCMVGSDPQAWFCLPGECCPGIPDYCGAGIFCCPEVQPGFGTFCGECCTNADCDGCSSCVDGVCEANCSECCEVGEPEDWFCLPGECCPGVPGYCGEGLVCCPEEQPGFGTTCEQCCVDSDCGDNNACSTFTCVDHQCRELRTPCQLIDRCTGGCDPVTGCPTVSACPAGFTCCGDGTCVDLRVPGNCCVDANCGDDNNVCTQVLCNPSSHACVTRQLVCARVDACTTATCDPSTGCLTVSACATSGQVCCASGVCLPACPVPTTTTTTPATTTGDTA